MVYLDIIKPAFMDATDAIEPAPLVTSSGRLVRLPARYRVRTMSVLNYCIGLMLDFSINCCVFAHFVCWRGHM